MKLCFKSVINELYQKNVADKIATADQVITLMSLITVYGYFFLLKNPPYAALLETCTLIIFLILGLLDFNAAYIRERLILYRFGNLVRPIIGSGL